MSPFKQGFVLKCAEYGIQKEQAEKLFKLAGTALPPDPGGAAGMTLNTNLGQSIYQVASRLLGADPKQVARLNTPSGAILSGVRP